MDEQMDEDIKDIVWTLSDKADEKGKCLVSLIDLTKDTGMNVGKIEVLLDHLLEQGVIVSHEVQAYHSGNRSNGNNHRLWCFQLNFTTLNRETDTMDDM